MAVEIDLGIDGLDIDSKEAFSNSFNLLPRVVGTTRARVCSIRKVKTQKGTQVGVRVRPISSSSPEVSVGTVYDLLFGFSGFSATYSNRDLRQITAAIYGFSPDDKKVELMPKLAEAIDAGEELELIEADVVIDQYEKTNDDGETRVFARYSPAK